MHRSKRKCTIVCDSIAKYVSDLRGTEVKAFPGINVSRLSNKISRDMVNLDSDYVILHVGTNDVNTLTVDEICASYNDLISLVKTKTMEYLWPIDRYLETLYQFQNQTISAFKFHSITFS